MSSPYTKLISFLKEKNVTCKEFRHEPVRTSAQADAVRPEFTAAQGAKTIIIKARLRGKEKKYIMLVLPGDKRFDSKKVRKVVDCSSFSFVDDDTVIKLTDGIKPGGVHPFGNLFGLDVFVDESLCTQDVIIFNAGHKGISIALACKDFVRLVNPEVVDIT